MSSKLEIILNYYNNISAFSTCLWKSTTALARFDFGKLFKIWGYDKNFDNLPTTTKNFVYTEHLQALLSSIAKTKKYQGENITDKNWQNIFNELNNYDHFLHIKLQKLIGIENKNLIDAILKYIGDIKSLEFIELRNKVQLFLENNFEHYAKLFESAEKISNTSYPLTKEYFLYRYVAKAILYKPNVNYAEEFNKEKEIHLNFVRYISSLKQSYFKLEKAKDQFNEEHKINSWLIEKSNSISSHSGKIALTYSTLITGVILLRSYVFDEEEPLYELCALPTTILAILQLLLSFPSTVLSSKQTKIINYNLFKELESKTNDKSHFEDIKFLFDNTPTFSDNLINNVVICFRYAANLLLQPIDLLNNDTVNYFITCTALRWLSAAGVVEEQSKVTGFMHNKLLGFLHNKIVPALIENKLFSSEEIKPYFYVLFKHLKKNDLNEQKLQAIYKRLTDQDIDFNNPELNNIHTYSNWQDVAKYLAMATLLIDYICFYFRDPETIFYEDPMFYASVSIKFARLASLLISSYYGNKITQDVTGEELSNNIFFQNFYYNDAARLNMAIIPLIMFESIKDLKFLSLATLIDVLTTATSDLNVGKAISNADQIIAEQTAITINEISKTLSSHDAISSNDDIQVDLLGE